MLKPDESFQPLQLFTTFAHETILTSDPYSISKEIGTKDKLLQKSLTKNYFPGIGMEMFSLLMQWRSTSVDLAQLV